LHAHCDTSGESATCDVGSILAVCGDTVVNATVGETCDDGVKSGFSGSRAVDCSTAIP
jgi:hypothetical protein